MTLKSDYMEKKIKIVRDELENMKPKGYMVVIKDNEGRILIDEMTKKGLIEYNENRLNDFPYMVIDGNLDFEGLGYSVKGDLIKNYDEELDIDKLADIV